ncbi:MAG: hypothetical protein KBD63_08205 [Bacteriovoracaceae bacterium]|nr:hypothetical protein [Bacteriovoracaceae bacterium]
MKDNTQNTKVLKKSSATFFRKCHMCFQVAESLHEIEKCPHCKKSFMPLNYFQKVHGQNVSDIKNAQLFAPAQDLAEDDLLYGLMALW